ncbi:hypothetical protein FQN54_001467 [Arachnomyces sp. PD_36]|nr:hypothetical protein FQN54_001467 [Arachnomyces sp. PD_36]
MVNQREAPKAPLSPERSNDQMNNPHAHPEFGRPSLGAPSQSQSNVPFNIPKANRPRPEHHRSSGQVPQLNKNLAENAPTAGSGTGAPRPSSKPFDPFIPVKPSAYTSYRSQSPGMDDDDFYQISKPSNTSWTTKPTPAPIYSSKPTNKAKNLQNFVDLTTNDIGFATNHRQYDESRSMEAYTYLDSEKANENIKALLEGAFEDDDDKPKTRSRKAKIQTKIDDLAKQMEGTTVKDKDEEGGGEKAEEEEEEEEEEDDGTVEGLKVKLLPHQIEGVEWMRNKESRLKKTRGTLPKGGILADDMGLGKTVQAISLILTNPRPNDKDDEANDEDDAKLAKEKEKRKLPANVGKSTLVVAPLALIKQWESEIDTKVEDSHRLRVCVYHGAQRAKQAGNLKKFDVVITTYGTLSSEHEKTPKAGEGCFGVHWYRILLDEAHTIKNRNAKATKAACALESEYRWCLTGTPLQNNMDELQSLIKFLRIKPYDELAAWKEQITRPLNNGRGALAIRRLQLYLKAFMKRRTKDVLKLNDNLNPDNPDDKGKGAKASSNGFQITKREVIKVSAKFTEGERAFYKRLEQRTDRSLEQMMGGSQMNYASALVLLLRLRQACNHPDLVKSELAQDKDVLLNAGNTGSQTSKKDDIEGVADLLGGLSVTTKRCDVCQIELDKEEARNGAVRCDECEVDLKTQVQLEPGEKKSKKKKKKQKKSRHESSSRNFEESQKDRSRRNRRVIIDSDDEDEGEGEWIAPEGERSHPNLGKAGGADDEDAEGKGEWLDSDEDETADEDEEDDDEEEDDSEEDEEDEDSEEESDASEQPIDRDLLASTKIRHLMKILNGEAHQFKFIVFSFFTSMLDKIEPFLKRDKIGYVRYDGGMRNDMREASLNKLRNAKHTRVLLCSLRAGSLGLNLTAASRVVILEPFWNPFVEEQAIDRVHRLNQTVDVKIYKVTVKDTVEERILDLQERKRELANATIEGKTAAAKLTMKDMMALFGHDAEARFTGDNRELDMVGASRTRLLESRSEEIGEPVAPPSSYSSSQERVRERGSGSSKRSEDPIYGRRW